MKLLKQASTLFLGLLIFSLVPIVLFVFVTSRSPILFGIRSFVVMTGSMSPALPVGSMVFTARQNSYNIGQIITFKRGGISVTHRILDIQNSQFITKGDANNTPDSQKVNQADIIGHDVAVVPFIGRLTGFIKTPLGFILLLGIPTLLFVLYEALQLKSEWEKVIERRVREKIQSSSLLDTLKI